MEQNLGIAGLNTMASIILNIVYVHMHTQESGKNEAKFRPCLLLSDRIIDTFLGGEGCIFMYFLEQA